MEKKIRKINDAMGVETPEICTPEELIEVKEKNEILEELWRTRKKIEAEEGGDLRKVFDRMRQKTSKSPLKRYSGAIRRKSSSKIA